MKNDKILEFCASQRVEVDVYEDPDAVFVSVGIDDGDDGASLLIEPDEADALAAALTATAAEVRRRRGER